MKKTLAIPLKAMEKLAPRPLNDAIFKLNDDCLAEVLSYLPLDDVNKIIQSDKRFRPAAKIRFAQGGFDVINPTFLQKYPKDVLDDIFETYGKRAKRMKFEDLEGEDFISIISKFEVLDELLLSEVYLYDIDEHEFLPKRLKSLEIERCFISHYLFEEWCTELNATLKTLRFIYFEETSVRNQFTGLFELHNITSLLIDGCVSDEFVASLLLANEDLSSLTLLNRDSINSSRSTDYIWKILPRQQRLNYLLLDRWELNCDVPSGLFPELTYLSLSTHRFHEVIINLACESTLDTLIVKEGACELFCPYALTRFSNLRHLELVDYRWAGAEDSQLDGYSALNQVRTLILIENYFGLANEVLHLAHSMPHLTKLILRDLAFYGEKDHNAKKLEKKMRAALMGRSKPFEFEITLRSNPFLRW